MKRIFTLIIFVSFSVTTFSQTSLTNDQKLSSLCKVWGFLKYYHPVVAKGKHDWDQELMSHIPLVLSAQNSEDISKIYLHWIKGLGKVKACRKCKQDYPDSMKYNLDLSWLEDKALFNDSLISMLHYIQHNRNHKRNYYVQQNIFVRNTSFTNEKKYKDAIYPNMEYRLLTLFRYWNIINYYYPYKNIMDKKWDKVLTDMLPKFQFAGDTISYHLAIKELVASINDSHAGFASLYTNKYLGLYYSCADIKLIDNKAIITGTLNDSLSLTDDLQKGDIILSVNGKSVADIIQENLKYAGGSNMPTRLRNLRYAILRSQTNTMQISYDRNGVLSTKTIHAYYFAQLKYKATKSTTPYTMLAGNIGYVNMGVLERKDIEQMMEKFKNTDAIIFDIRNYPNGTMYHLANYLCANQKPFAKFSHTIMSYPGVSEFTSCYYCGKKNNSDHYKGRIILLFNEYTQSHAEFTCMALQTAPNVTCIGSQTAGADGNVSNIILPGGFETYMTGIGVFYPNGKQTQRIGIVPDIEVKPSLEGIRTGKDEVLDKALLFIKTGR